jgi:hypothetical protein
MKKLTETSLHWGDETPEAIKMNFGQRHDIRTVIICAKSGFDQKRRFQSADP